MSLFDRTRPTSAEVDSDMCNLATGEVVPIPTHALVELSIYIVVAPPSATNFWSALA